MSLGAALLIHGAGGGGWEWNVWRGVFEAAGLQVSAPDLQPVAAGLGATRLDDYVMQMRDALAALARPRALVGASLGGLIATRLAGEEDPSLDALVDALVLVNPLPPAPWHQRLPARTWRDVVPWFHDARFAGSRRALPDADAATVLLAFRHWRNESGAVLREAYAGVEIAKPTCPLLCIASGDDTDVPAQTTQALAHAWNSELLLLPGASHIGPLLGNESARLAAQVAAWLSPG